MTSTRHLDPRLRISLYVGVAATGAIAAAWGVITQDVVDAILPALAGVLAVGGGVTAVKNITPAVVDPSPVQDVVVEVVTQLPAILAALDELRAAVHSLPAAGPVTDALGEYVPEIAPWLEGVELEGERGGEHRLIE